MLVSTVDMAVRKELVASTTAVEQQQQQQLLITRGKTLPAKPISRHSKGRV
jgi:hypothetical protein